jgi:DNA-3-methyladenine glycosylase II
VKLAKLKASIPKALTNQTLSAAAQTLAARDRHLRLIHQKHGPPPMWGRRPGFPTLLRILLEQQVSLISARAMFDRLKKNLDSLTPEVFIDRGEAYLRSLGMTRQKAHYAIQIAESCVRGDLKFIGRMTDEEAHATLTRIKGVGPWTANIYLLMALRRPDIWPDGDIALATSAMKVWQMEQRPSFIELAAMAERWRPYRSVAARMLWQYYLAEQNRL